MRRTAWWCRGTARSDAIRAVVRQLLPTVPVPAVGNTTSIGAALASAPTVNVAKLLQEYELATTASADIGASEDGTPGHPAAGPSSVIDTVYNGSVSEYRDATIALVRAYGSTRNLDAARRVFLDGTRAIAAKQRVQSPVIADTFLSLLAQQDALSRQEVQFVLRVMQRHCGGLRTPQTFLALFEMQLRRYDDCQELWDQMHARGICPTPAILTILVHGVVLARPNPLPTTRSSTPNPNAGGGTGGGAMMPRVDARFIVDVTRGYVASVEHTTTSVLEQLYVVLVEHRDIPPEQGLWLLFELEMQCLNQKTSLTKCVERGSLIRLLLKCARGGDATTAMRLVALMERQNMPTTTDACALLLWTFAAALEVERAMDTLEDMARRGMLDGVDHTKRFVLDALNLPMPKHYLAMAAEAFYTLDAVDRAFYRLEARKREGLSVTVHALDLIVLACAKLGDEARAVETLQAYATLGVVPRAQSYNALLVVCTMGATKAKGLVNGGLRKYRPIFDAMTKAGVQPNYQTLRTLIRLAVANDDIDEALQFMERAPTYTGVRVDVEMLLPILERAARVGDLDTVVQVAQFGLKCDVGFDGALLRTAAQRLRAAGVDPAPVEELVPVHQQLMRGA